MSSALDPTEPLTKAMSRLPKGGRTRLAPTPSGLLHAGNAVNFLITDLLARATDSRVLLRIDDLDHERVRPAYIADVFDALRWLDIRWDEGPGTPGSFKEGWSQRQRLDDYRTLLAELRRQDAVYACRCSRRRFRQAVGTTGGTCDCRQRAISLDAPDTVWRLPTSGVSVRVPALLGPERVVDLGTAMPDPVLRQRDGTPAYQVASLSDDVRFGITFIVRGEDLLPSTACQLHLGALLGLDACRRTRYVHHGLIRDPDGRKLSKSEGADSLLAMRSSGRSSEPLRTTAIALLRDMIPADQ